MEARSWQLISSSIASWVQVDGVGVSWTKRTLGDAVPRWSLFTVQPSFNAKASIRDELDET